MPNKLIIQKTLQTTFTPQVTRQETSPLFAIEPTNFNQYGDRKQFLDASCKYEFFSKNGENVFTDYQLQSV
jgi:hypothetical protein